MSEWTECLEGRDRHHHCYQGSHKSLLLCSNHKADARPGGQGSLSLLLKLHCEVWTICQWRQTTVPSGSFSKAVKAAPGSHFLSFWFPDPFASSALPAPPPSPTVLFLLGSCCLSSSFAPVSPFSTKSLLDGLSPQHLSHLPLTGFHSLTRCPKCCSRGTLHCCSSLRFLTCPST